MKKSTRIQKLKQQLHSIESRHNQDDDKLIHETKMAIASAEGLGLFRAIRKRRPPRRGSKFRR